MLAYSGNVGSPANPRLSPGRFQEIRRRGPRASPMPRKTQKLPKSNRRSERCRAASLKNLEKAWEANRNRWEFTPARRRVSLRTIKLAQRANRLHPRPFSPAQLEAARRNVAKAREAMRVRGRSPEHLAKLRESIARARAARTEKSIERQAMKILKHGVFARRLKGPLAPLGENPRDYQALHRLMQRYFAPQNPEEEKLVRLIADSVWRLHRVFFAQAALQLERLNFFLSKAPEPERPSPVDSRLRAYTLLTVLLERDESHRRSWRLIGATERLMRRLLRMRFGRDPNFQTGRRIIDPHAARQEFEMAEAVWLSDDPELIDMFYRSLTQM